MSMGRRREKQAPLWVAAPSLPRSPGHRFYEKLNELLREAEFDGAMETACAKHFEADGTVGRPSIAPGVYFRMLMVGFFEGIESERGIAWRCSDSLSLREFLGLLPGETVPDHSTISKMRKRLGSDAFETMFRFVLGVVEKSGLLKGKVMGVDSTYLRADASMKTIVRRDTGEVYQEFIKRLAKEDGIPEPTVEEAVRHDRNRKGKKTSNVDWKSKTDEDARIARLKDGRTRLAYKSEHVVDMETGVVVVAEVYTADQADTKTLPQSLEQARSNMQEARAEKRDDSDDEPPSATTSAPVNEGTELIEVVADKGYHKTALLHELQRSGYRTYLPEKKHRARKWTEAKRDMQRTLYANRARTRTVKGRALQRRRGELIERTFAHACETGGLRRVRLRGRDNVRKRYLVHIAALNLSLVMRKALGAGTPRALAATRKGRFWVVLMLWTLLAAVARRLGARLACLSQNAWHITGDHWRRQFAANFQPG
ncbi:MAG: transposase [Polyangiaceae bacterium]